MNFTLYGLVPAQCNNNCKDDFRHFESCPNLQFNLAQIKKARLDNLAGCRRSRFLSFLDTDFTDKH